jgi:hypothetical protein
MLANFNRFDFIVLIMYDLISSNKVTIGFARYFKILELNPSQVLLHTLSILGSILKNGELVTLVPESEESRHFSP